MPPFRYLAIVGPTASGKSQLALNLAEKFGGELICCDSVQLYKGFEIGAAGPSAAELSQVPHHLFYSLHPEEPFDAASYREVARRQIDLCLAKGKLPIIVGGTGLYLRALLGQAWSAILSQDPEIRAQLKSKSLAALIQELKVLDPVRLSEIHPHDRFRIERAVEICLVTGQPASQLKSEDKSDPSALIVYLKPDRSTLHKRIEKRVGQMISSGLIDETKIILSQVQHADLCKPLQSIGYKQVLQYLRGEISETQLFDAILFATRQYAKRQCTWFNKVSAHFEFASIEKAQDVLEQEWPTFFAKS